MPALLRIGPKRSDPSVIEYDDRSRSVRRPGGDQAALRAKSFAAFEALARAYPDPLSKDDLIDAVWGRAAVSDDSVVQCIADIRRALGDGDHRIVQTVPGEGYRLTEPAARTGTTPAAAEGAAGTRTLIAVIATAATLAIAAVLSLLIWSRTDEVPPDAPESDGDLTVAVIGFRSLDADPRWDRLASGLTSDIASVLNRPERLTVLSHSIVPQEGATLADRIATYRDLGAEFVVTGTIQAGGDGLRIYVELIDTATGRIAWDRRWQRRVEDFFVIQDEIVADIFEALANRWSGQLTGLTALRERKGTRNLTAYDLARRGVEAFDTYTLPALQEAETFFRAAVTEDPEFSDAWAEHAFTLGALAPMLPGDDLPALRAQQIESARQARHVDTSNTMGILAASWLAAEKDNRDRVDERVAAVSVAGRHEARVLAHLSLHAALVTDRYDEALAWGQEALRLDAEAPGWFRIGPGLALFFKGNYAEAAQMLRRAPQGHPVVAAFLAAAEVRAGNDGDADAARAMLRMLHPDFTTAHYLRAAVLYPHSKADVVRAAFDEVGIPAD